jgi:hypothetical protein
MSKVVTCALFLLAFIFGNQSIHHDVKCFVGNWYIYKDTSVKETDKVYKEHYLSEKSINTYSTILIMPYSYFVRENKMYILSLSKEDTIFIEKPKLLNSNTLKIVFEEPDYIILKRVIDSNKLGDFVKQKIDKKTYYPSYLKRKNYWEKYGMLPENGDFENPPKMNKSSNPPGVRL